MEYKRLLMKKLHFIDSLETDLNKDEIRRRMSDITFWPGDNLVFERKGKYFGLPDYGEDMFSFTTYFWEKRYDYLMPRIYMTILEKEEGCVLNIYYRIKGEIIFSYSFLSLFWFICIVCGIMQGNYCGPGILLVFYTLLIWCARSDCVDRCRNAVKVIKERVIGTTLNINFESGDAASLEKLLKEENVNDPGNKVKLLNREAVEGVIQYMRDNNIRIVSGEYEIPQTSDYGALINALDFELEN